MANKIIDNRKLTGGILTLPGFNTNSWYQRNADASFTVNGAWNGSENIFNWVLTKTINSKYTKSGVVKVASVKKSLTIRFDTGFPDNNYFLFFNTNANSTLYWSTKYTNRFVINSSFSLGDEITWFAIHKTIISSSGFNKSRDIYAGTRVMNGVNTTDKLDDEGHIWQSLDITNNANSNNTQWYKSELIIAPNLALDGVQVEPAYSPLIDSAGKPIVDSSGNTEYNYSIMLSSNENINRYYVEKASDRVKIGGSYPVNCNIDYLMVKTGVDWWNLI